jgi:hypothetical protein
LENYHCLTEKPKNKNFQKFEATGELSRFFFQFCKKWSPLAEKFVTSENGGIFSGQVGFLSECTGNYYFFSPGPNDESIR